MDAEQEKVPDSLIASRAVSAALFMLRDRELSEKDAVAKALALEGVVRKFDPMVARNKAGYEFRQKRKAERTTGASDD
jgi:hypothetical protein